MTAPYACGNLRQAARTATLLRVYGERRMIEVMRTRSMGKAREKAENLGLRMFLRREACECLDPHLALAAPQSG